MAKVQWTFANTPLDTRQLAKVHMTFASTLPGHSPIGESHVDFRQHNPGHSPIGESSIRSQQIRPWVLKFCDNFMSSLKSPSAFSCTLTLLANTQ